MQYYDANPEVVPKPPSEGWNADDNGKADTLKLDDIVLTSQEQSQIKDIFDLFDTDGGGSIDSDEMDAAMYALGFQPSIGKQHIKEQAGPGNKKVVTVEEFTAMMKGELMIANPLETIWAAFTALSLAGEHAGIHKPVLNQGCSSQRGTLVTLEGLKRACREYDVVMSDGELKVMMDEIDTNGSGTVDREEFMQIMHNTPWF